MSFTFYEVNYQDTAKERTVILSALNYFLLSQFILSLSFNFEFITKQGAYNLEIYTNVGQAVASMIFIIWWKCDYKRWVDQKQVQENTEEYEKRKKVEESVTELT